MYDAIRDWIFNPDDRFLVKLLKRGVFTAATLGLAASPLLYQNYLNDKSMKDAVYPFDTRLNHVFNSISDCVAKNYDLSLCEKSYQKALEASKSSLLMKEFYSNADCLKAYGECTHSQEMRSSFISMGKFGTMYSNSLVDLYYPVMAAWQVQAKNIELVMPLYAAKQEGKAIRPDGKVFTLK